MIPIELLVAWGALLIAGGWIIRQQLKLNEQNDTLESAEAALEEADKALDVYQHVLRDVAIGHTILEMTHDGYIIATHRTLGKASLH